MGTRQRKAQRALLVKILGDADYTETLRTGEDAGKSAPLAAQLVALREAAERAAPPSSPNGPIQRVVPIEFVLRYGMPSAVATPSP